MPTRRKYDQETRERAVRMYLDRLNEGDISKRGARVEIGELLGINEQTLRNWVHDQVGEGGTPATRESVNEENARPRKENAQLRRAARTHAKAALRAGYDIGRDQLERLQGYGQAPKAKNGPALGGYGTEAMAQALKASIMDLPQQLRRTLTWEHPTPPKTQAASHHRQLEAGSIGREFITTSIEDRATVITEGLPSCPAALTKRWLKGIRHGRVEGAHLHVFHDEPTFRFNPRSTLHRGLTDLTALGTPSRPRPPVRYADLDMNKRCLASDASGVLPARGDNPRRRPP